MEEKWLYLKDFPRIQISNLGRVRGVMGIIRKVYITKDGYELLTITNGRKNKKTFLIHRLVAEYFCNKPSDKHKQVDHIDRNGKNNKADNLRWVTPQQNLNNRIVPLEVISALFTKFKKGYTSEEVYNNLVNGGNLV